MKAIVRGLLVVIVIIGIAVAGFSFYGSFLVDYSLNNLEKAMTVSEEHGDLANPLSQHVYQSLVEGMALDEAVEDDASVQDVVFLDLAARSMGEATDRMGNQRAGVYLEQILTKRKETRHIVLRWFDKVYYFVLDLLKGARSMVSYAKEQVQATKTVEQKTPEYSSVLILSEADQKVEAGELDEAILLYEKFLDFYPDSPERGFVLIALSNVLLRQENFNEAKTLLNQTRREFLGTEEGAIAGNFLKRLTKLQERQTLIKQLKKMIPKSEGTEQGELLKLKLAMAEFSSYQFNEAEALLKVLVRSTNSQIKQKAKFYLGWLYKMTKQLDQSTDTLLDLAESGELQGELKLGLHAQLADTYYLQNDIEKALDHYEVVSGSIDQTLGSLKASEGAWTALADLEKANIYYYDLGDKEKGEKALGNVKKSLKTKKKLDKLSTKIDSSSKLNMRDRAFRLLSKGKVHGAFDLLNKNLNYFPRDPWTHSGLATVYLLFADLDKARDFALKGYRWYGDEYTASVLAYVYGYMDSYEEAIVLYENAIAKNPDYLPAKFNLACMYLEVRDYGQAVLLLHELDRRVPSGENLMRAKVMNNMAYAYWWLGQKEKSRELFGRAVKFRPDFELAKINYEQVAKGETPRMLNFKGT